MSRGALASIVVLALGVVVACRSEQPASTAPPVAAASSQPATSNVAQRTFPIRVDGTRFVDASGRPFEWRGATAFRLVEMMATGRERDVVAYLDWAKGEQLTVLRVLLMGPTLFKLTPEAGRAALPRLLDLAKERGLSLEVVAFADTINQTIDYETHVRELGRVALERGNAFVEMANEPGHPTQDKRIHDPAFLQRLAAQLPESLVVALGSVEYDDGFAAADYVTTHTDRGRDWQHVLAVADAGMRLAKFKKPVVSDEPIGAGPEYQLGRRDNEPSRFAAAAALTKLAGLGATFHYEGGLQAKIPEGREAACFAAWQVGLSLVSDAPADGRFVTADDLTKIVQTAGTRAAFGRVAADRAMIVLIDPSPAVSVTFAAGWKETRRSGVPGVQVVLAERSSP